MNAMALNDPAPDVPSSSFGGAPNIAPVAEQVATHSRQICRPHKADVQPLIRNIAAQVPGIRYQKIIDTDPIKFFADHPELMSLIFETFCEDAVVAEYFARNGTDPQLREKHCGKLLAALGAMLTALKETGTRKSKGYAELTERALFANVVGGLIGGTVSASFNLEEPPLPILEPLPLSCPPGVNRQFAEILGACMYYKNILGGKLGTGAFK
uniref:GLOBIN domain-containing protein n=1 Tax=Panagrellus redivivus TaxID=6233 RepID=A0A7E4UVF9_PANRE